MKQRLTESASVDIRTVILEKPRVFDAHELKVEIARVCDMGFYQK